MQQPPGERIDPIPPIRQELPMFAGLFTLAMLVAVPLLSLRYGADSRRQQHRNWNGAAPRGR